MQLLPIEQVCHKHLSNDLDVDHPAVSKSHPTKMYAALALEVAADLVLCSLN